jgi:hypothetical protein
MDSKTDTTPKAGRLKRAMPSNGRFTKDFVKMVNKQNTYQKVVPPFYLCIATDQLIIDQSEYHVITNRISRDYVTTIT